MTPDLVQLARSEEFDSLDEAWLASLEDPGNHRAYCDTVETLCRMDMSSKALSLAAPMVDALSEHGRPEAAAELAHTLVHLGAHNDGIARRLFELLAKLHEDDDWFALLCAKAGVTADSLTTETLAEFDHLRRFTAGNVVYHRGGWGEGVVEAFDSSQEEVTILFAAGRTQAFPLSTIIEKFRPLDPDDLRSMRLTAPQDLQRMVTEDPSGLIQKAARLRRGRITSAQVKEELCPSVIPTKKWASFWKKAKAAAAHDPWLQVEGTTTRPMFVLRDRPVSLADEARRTLERAHELGERIGIVRQYLDRCHEESTKGTLTEMALSAVEDALSKESAAHAEVLDGILLLEKHGIRASVPAVVEVQRMLMGDDGEFRPEAFDTLPTQESREHAVGLVPEALGEGWIDLCIGALTRIPGSVVEQIVDAIVEAGQGPRVLDAWSAVAPYPRRHPILTYLLGRLYADGVFAEREDLPDPATLGRVLMHLGRVLTEERRGNIAFARLLTRLTSLLAGRRGLLARILRDVDRDALSTYLGIADRAGPDFPTEISDVILKVVADRFPELTEKQRKPFWELDYVFVTARGLDRQREIYRELVDVKIAENSAAIGRAASHGDLSENSEWEAAMEEQRNLTARAADMDQELRSARLIEDQDIPDDVVAPGTEVVVEFPVSGERRTMAILGPWDADAGDSRVVNYRAPVAQALLGKSAGDEAALPGFSESENARIVSVTRII